MAAFPGSIAFDEFGRPFIILRDQENQKRLTGNDAIKVREYVVFFFKNHMILLIIFKISLKTNTVMKKYA